MPTDGRGGAVPQLRCAELLSLRLVQEQLAERYGARRSIGAIVADLRRWRCAYALNSRRLTGDQIRKRRS